MKKSRCLVLLSTALVLCVWAAAEMRINAHSKVLIGSGGVIGPDVIVGDMPSTFRWGSSGGRTGYSVGTTSCNIGDEELTWIANSDQHPVIGQNLYRVKNGRIEQLGQSWLKHGFFALSQSLCGSCQSTNGSALGIGCSDPYGASLNGQQGPLPGQSGTGGLGPRSEVNATTGDFLWPPGRLASNERGVLGGRISVLNSDVDPNQNAGALYFIGSQYIQPEDAAAGNDLNNASYRRVFVSGGNFELNTSPSFQTVREQSPINAWKSVHSDVELFNVDIPGDGRVIVGVRTTAAGAGFHTEIAVENLNSHQSVRAVDVDCCVGSVSSPGFRDVDYHAEDYSGTDWAPIINGSQIGWSTETFAQNQNANALRWGTMYSYWFDSEFEPATVTLGLFRPGDVIEVSVELIPVLLGDINGDGAVNLLDVDPFVSLIGSGDYLKAGDMNGDGSVNLLDVDGFVAALSGN